MKFEEMKYERPDFEKTSKELNLLLDELENADNSVEFLKLFDKMNTITNHVFTMSTLSSIRHTINTADEFYDKENSYWDEITPKYMALDTKSKKIALSKPYRDELLKEIPETYFKLAEFQLKSFSEDILDDLQEENRLTSEYVKLKASAKIEFDGEILNLAQFKPKFESNDRNYRKKAFDAYIKFYSDNAAKFEEIYDKLVKLRDKMAKKLGYENFITLGYYRMNRFDYNEEMVSNYRKQVLEDITPFAKKLTKQQADRLNIDKVRYYDYTYKYVGGNPTPKGTFEEQISAARQMYHEMSSETGEFIDVIIDNNLWDLQSKPNKGLGGYCTSIHEYKVPFIFANFNGTSGDVDVLTHEAGHAFQAYMSRNIKVPECVWPTMESCEIHSMSMEFFAHPWMEKFFKEDTEKYYHSHVESAIMFLPYGVLVDHFQHEVYKNPNMTPEERYECWRNLEKQYLPHKDYEGCEFLEKGGWWFQQGHIFEMPFYYIDYTLAQVCALQFFKKSKDNYAEAWKDYLHLCKLGGTMSFVQLVKEAKLNVPFENGSLKSIVELIENHFNTIDESKL